MTDVRSPGPAHAEHGPVPISSHTIEILAATALLSVDGSLVKLGDLWRDKPAVLLYLRHYGCQSCKQEAAIYRKGLSRLTDLGSFVAIGLGSLEQGRDFHSTHGEGLPALIDFSKATYEALGFMRSARRAYGMQAMVRLVSALGKGFYPGLPQGDPFQLGGVVVIKRGGERGYVYRSDFAGDHLPVERTIELMTR